MRTPEVIARRRIRSKRVAVTIGVILFLVASWFLYQAWDARGQRAPRVARPFIWW